MNNILDNIRPFVRYAHLITLKDFLSSKKMVAYDFRLFYVVEGRGKIIVNDEEYDVCHGSLIVWHPGLEYSIFNEDGRDLVLAGFNFDLDFLNSDRKAPILPSRLENYKEENMLLPKGFSSEHPFYEVVCIHRAFEFETELIRMVSDYKNKLRYYEHKLSGRLLSILVDLIDREGKGGDGYYDNDKIEKILAVIKENYSGPLSNEIIAERLGYHKNHVNRLMVFHTGTSLHRYLQNYRLERAMELLDTTNYQISEIATMVGFDDFSHFSKYFKKRIGYPPSALRRLVNK